MKKITKPTISVKEKKDRFTKLLLPEIQAVYKELNAQYKEIKIAIYTNTKIEKIESLKKTYKVTTNEDLLMALKPHPASVTLAQAAMESSWGTSRFFREANNVFGIWSFNKNEPRIAANGQRGSKKIWLKKYNTIRDSVRDYYKNMGRSFAFVEFRKERVLSNDPLILVTKLDRYSEKGSAYGDELYSMITFNKFMQYDEKIKMEVINNTVTLNEEVITSDEGES